MASYNFVEIPYNEYFGYFGPDYRLDVCANNMTNLNTPQYLQECKMKIIENLRHTQFAPSVQMQGIPPDFCSISDDDEEDPDQRKSSKYWCVCMCMSTIDFMVGLSEIP